MVSVNGSMVPPFGAGGQGGGQGSDKEKGPGSGNLVIMDNETEDSGTVCKDGAAVGGAKRCKWTIQVRLSGDAGKAFLVHVIDARDTIGTNCSRIVVDDDARRRCVHLPELIAVPET
jgi:hypothetical protein